MDIRALFKDMVTRDNLLVFAILAIATGFSIAAQSFNFPFGNNVHHIPFVLDYANNAEGPSDIYHQSLSRFISGFWVIIGSVATEENIHAVFFIAHVLFRFLTLFMIWKITSMLSQNKTLAAALAVSLILFFPGLYYFSPVGKSELLVSYLTHSQAVVAIVLIAWFFLIRQQFLVAAAFTAIAFIFNAFVGIWLGVAAGIAMIYLYWPKGIPFLVGHGLKMLLIFVVIASPVIFWLLHSVIGVAPYEPFEYRDFLTEFFPYHNYFVYHLQETVAFVIFAATGYLALRWTASDWDDSKLQIVRALLITYSVIFLIGLILPYVTGNRLILSLVPLRMDSYLIFLIAIIILVWHNTALRRAGSHYPAFALIALFSLVNGNVLLFIAALLLDKDFNKKATGEKAFGWLLIAMLAISHLHFDQTGSLFLLSDNTQYLAFALQTVVIAFSLLGHKHYLSLAIICLSAAALKMVPEISTGAIMGALILIYGLIAFSLAKTVKWLPIAPALLILLISGTHGNIMTTILLAAAFLLPVLAIAGYLLLQKFRPKQIALHTSVLIVLFVGFSFMGAGQAFLRGSIEKKPEDAAAYREAQLWARQNTEPHTVFLPIKIIGFSAWSRRPVWIERSTGAMIMWAPENHEFWSKRVKKMRAMETVGDAMTLAREEDIPYIVLKKSRTMMDPDFSHCIEFENFNYIILKTC